MCRHSVAGFSVLQYRYSHDAQTRVRTNAHKKKNAEVELFDFGVLKVSWGEAGSSALGGRHRKQIP